MSDNDLILRGEVEDILFDACDGTIDEGALAYLISELKKIPAVPQEMSAREYLKTRWSMCLMYDNCEGCPFCDLWEDFTEKPILCYSYERMDSGKAVAIVEKWAKEHPERSEQ